MTNDVNTNNAPELVLEPMWNIDVGPCFAVKNKDWLPADKMRDIAAFLNHALQAELGCRQPAAVSADAVELAELLINFISKPARYPINAEVETLLGMYRDACRLDGARKVLEAAAEIADDYGADETADAIRALSPETICGGGE